MKDEKDKIKYECSECGKLVRQVIANYIATKDDKDKNFVWKCSKCYYKKDAKRT